MSRYLLFLLLSIASSSLFAQAPTITNSSFPQAGDVYFTAQDTATPGVIITASGPDQTWVFDNFIPPYAETSEVTAAADGSVGTEYPDADIIVPQFGGEGYASNSGDSIEVFGFYGDGGTGFGFNFNVALSPTMIAVQTSMNYEDTFVDDFGFLIEIAPSDYPALDSLIKDNLPLPISIDSIRITYDAMRYDTLDAWGNLTTNHGNYDVLRLKRSLYSFTKYEAKTFAGWFDATTLADLPGAGADTTVTYDFIAEGEKVQIMSATMNEDNEIQDIVYKVDTSEVVVPEPSAIFTVSPDYQVAAYPNPAFDQVYIAINGLPNGAYRLQVCNATGQQIHTEKLAVYGDLIHPLKLSSFAKGSYFYSLVNEKGKVLVANTLLIMK